MCYSCIFIWYVILFDMFDFVLSTYTFEGCVTMRCCNIPFTTRWVPAKPPVNWQRCPGTEQKLTARLEEYVRKAALIWVRATLQGTNILLMERIRLTSWGNGTLSHYLQGFIHPRWLAGFLPSTVSLSPTKALLKMMFLLQRWAMLVSWRVHRWKLRWFHLKITQLKSKIIWTKSLIWVQNVNFPWCCFFMSYCHPCFHHVLFALAMGDDAIRLLTIHIYIIYLF